MSAIYVAGQYARRPELAGYARILRARGHKIVSTWLDETFDPKVKLSEVADAELTQLAEQDLDDLRQADTLLFFAEHPEVGVPRGGRHVELGVAIAGQKRILLVSHRENLFCYLPDVEFYPTVAEAISALG